MAYRLVGRGWGEVAGGWGVADPNYLLGILSFYVKTILILTLIALLNIFFVWSQWQPPNINLFCSEGPGITRNSGWVSAFIWCQIKINMCISFNKYIDMHLDWGFLSLKVQNLSLKQRIKQKQEDCNTWHESRYLGYP